MINAEFWAGRRVLITGHTGFKGSWLTLWLRNLGADVWGYSLPPQTTLNLYEKLQFSSSSDDHLAGKFYHHLV